MKHVTIYADGACSGNPGPGGWGGFAKQIRRMSPLARRLRGNRSGMTGALRRPVHKEKA